MLIFPAVVSNYQTANLTYCKQLEIYQRTAEENFFYPSAYNGNAGGSLLPSARPPPLRRLRVRRRRRLHRRRLAPPPDGAGRDPA